MVARRRIMEVLNAARARQRLEEEEVSEGEEDTWVVPLVQMKPLGIQVDEQVTQVRWRRAPAVNNNLISLCQLIPLAARSPWQRCLRHTTAKCFVFTSD